MNGILLLAHGSRREDTKRTVNVIAGRLEEKLLISKVWVGYMEMAEPSIHEAVEDMVRNGVEHIYAVPIFLFDGIHIVKDIPDELEEIRRKHPGLQITLAKTIGEDERLADILADRAAEAGFPSGKKSEATESR